MSIRAASWIIAGLFLLLPAAPARAAIITNDPSLPPLYPSGAYFYPASEPTFNGGGVQATFSSLEDHLSGPVTRTPIGADERESFSGQWVAQISVNGGLPAAATASGPELWVAHGKSGVLTGSFQVEILAMDLSGSSSYGSFLVRESPTLASLGQTTITPLGGGLYQISSFFDVFTEMSVDGGQTWIPSQGSSRVVLGAAPEPSTLSLLAAGILLSVYLRHRRERGWKQLSRCSH